MKKFFTLTLALLASFSLCWATDVIWDFTGYSSKVTLENAKSYSFSATDGVTEMRYTAGSSDEITAIKNANPSYLKENGNTGGTSAKDVDGTTPISKNRLIRLFVTGKGKLTINCNGTNGVYKVLNGSASGTTLIASLSANTQSAEINATTSPIWIETTTKGYITSIVWSPTGAPACPSGLTISGTNAYTEGDEIELTAALSEGNGDISYQWYKGSVAPANAISGATNAKYEVASCTTANAGDYFCVASKAECEDAVNASAYTVTVKEDTRCFIMPEITSTPSNLASIDVTGGTLADVGDGKTLKMQSTGIGFGNGNAARLKVTLTGSSIVEGTKITIYYNNANSDGSGIGLYNENYEHQVINETGVTGNGSFSHTFTAAEAANYADIFLIDRNNTGKGIIVGSIIVEDCGPAVVKHTITLNYNDGATPAGSLSVVDGKAAVKPADPERGKYTFLGWFVGDTDTEYNWTLAVTGDITLKAHWQDPWTITFNADGGSAVAAITVKHNTKAEKPADPTKDNYDFNGWYIGDTETPFDWDANVTANYSLKAHWLELVAKYDIEYYDGETKIGTEEQVRVDKHPTAEGIETDKPHYTFVGWFTSSTLEGDPVDLNTITPAEGLKLYGKWTANYSSSINIEQWVLDNGKKDTEFRTLLGDKKYIYSNINNLDSLNDDKTNRNYAFLGQKLKASNASISFLLKSGSTVKVRFGNVGADFKIYEGETANTKTSDQLSNATTSSSKVYTYTAAADIIIKIENVTNDKTLVVKQIMINEDIQDVTLPDTPTALDNTDVNAKAVKSLKNGVLIIEKNGKKYNIIGAELR